MTCLCSRRTHDVFGRQNSPSKGFTLIELLIVVAIIAILASIAVVNFLEAQVRAKVSRALGDMRTVALGLEAYAVDTNTYPYNDGVFNVLPIEITTPVAYVQTGSIIDPFVTQKLDLSLNNPLLARFYTYTKIVTRLEAEYADTVLHRPVPFEGVDDPAFNLGAFSKYGKWRMCSKGPDQEYQIPGYYPPWEGIDIPYDPSNGTRSWGNILRTHKETRPGMVRP